MPTGSVSLAGAANGRGFELMGTDVKRVRRFDYFDATALAKPEELVNGFLRLEGMISRVGVQIYQEPGGRIRRELRLPDEVFDPESLRSFAMVPLTNTHPPKLLDSSDATSYVVGAVGENIRQAGDYVAASFTIYDERAKTDAKQGRAQLSCGYDCEMDESPPVQELILKWGDYDAIQRKIRGNHLALVDEARAGAGARARLDGLKLDAADAVMLRSDPSTTPPKRSETTMAHTIRIDGFAIELTDANAPAIQQAIERALANQKDRLDAAHKTEKDRADGLEKRLGIVKKNGTVLIGRVGQLRGRIDAMKARMMSCDECDGSGKVMDGDAEKKCDYCDGAGKFRMHDAYADASPDGSEQAESQFDDDPDNDGDDHDEMDEDELEVEQESEEKAGAAKKDARRDSRRDHARRDAKERAQKAKQRRRDSLKRRIDRAVMKRSALVLEAHRHLGDQDFAKMDDAAIKKAVVLKLCPEAKLDGKTPQQIADRFDTEVERLPKEDAAAAVRAGVLPRLPPLPHRPTVQNQDGSGLRGREKMLWNQRNPGKAQ